MLRLYGRRNSFVVFVLGNHITATQCTCLGRILNSYNKCLTCDRVMISRLMFACSSKGNTAASGSPGQLHAQASENGTYTLIIINQVNQLWTLCLSVLSNRRSSVSLVKAFCLMNDHLSCNTGHPFLGLKTLLCVGPIVFVQQGPQTRTWTTSGRYHWSKLNKYKTCKKQFKSPVTQTFEVVDNTRKN